MNILNLNAEEQKGLIKELSGHVTESRWGLIEKVIKNRTRYVTLVLEDIYQSHNAAAVVRSCDGFGIQDVHVIENRNKLIIKDTSVSMGADKWINFTYYDNTEKCIQKLKEKGYKVAATALGKDSIKLEQVPIDQPVALMIGTEKLGLTEKACEMADYLVELPMYGFTQSYNLSVCAALSLHSLMSRLRNSSINWRLSENEQREVVLTWLTRCVNHWDAIAENWAKKEKSGSIWNHFG